MLAEAGWPRTPPTAASLHTLTSPGSGPGWNGSHPLLSCPAPGHGPPPTPHSHPCLQGQQPTLSVYTSLGQSALPFSDHPPHHHQAARSRSPALKPCFRSLLHSRAHDASWCLAPLQVQVPQPAHGRLHCLALAALAGDGSNTLLSLLQHSALLTAAAAPMPARPAAPAWATKGVFRPGEYKVAQCPPAPSKISMAKSISWICLVLCQTQQFVQGPTQPLLRPCSLPDALPLPPLFSSARSNATLDWEWDVRSHHAHGDGLRP